jgi:hypothetical protein
LEQLRPAEAFFLHASKICRQHLIWRTSEIAIDDRRLNGGVRGTNAELWGLGGNAPDWQARGFATVGFAFKGPRKSTIVLASEAAHQPHHPYYFDGSSRSYGKSLSERNAQLSLPTPDPWLRISRNGSNPEQKCVRGSCINSGNGEKPKLAGRPANKSKQLDSCS